MLYRREAKDAVAVKAAVRAPEILQERRRDAAAPGLGDNTALLVAGDDTKRQLIARIFGAHDRGKDRVREGAAEQTAVVRFIIDGDAPVG